MTLLRTARVFTNWGDYVPLFRSMDGRESMGRPFEYEVDPRALHSFLPTCTTAEAVEILGPINRLVKEASEPAVALTRSTRSGELHVLYQGTSDETWRAERAPLLPEDFRCDYYNVEQMRIEHEDLPWALGDRT